MESVLSYEHYQVLGEVSFRLEVLGLAHRHGPVVTGIVVAIVAVFITKMTKIRLLMTEQLNVNITITASPEKE